MVYALGDVPGLGPRNMCQLERHRSNHLLLQPSILAAAAVQREDGTNLMAATEFGKAFAEVLMAAHTDVMGTDLMAVLMGEVSHRMNTPGTMILDAFAPV